MTEGRVGKLIASDTAAMVVMAVENAVRSCSSVISRTDGGKVLPWS
jgi:hypothetical protein